MRFDIDGLKHFENIIHPNLLANKHHYLKNKVYVFPQYHGCGYKNKNGTNKKIEYKRGHQCLFPTDKRYWKKNVAGRLVPRKLHYTRYMSNISMNEFAKTKGDKWYDYKTKTYKHRKEWYRNADPFKILFSSE